MEKNKALEMALGQIDKQFGKGSVMLMGEKTTLAIGVVPAGALALDVRSVLARTAQGRVVEIFGPESSDEINTRHAHRGRSCFGAPAASAPTSMPSDGSIYATAIEVDVDELLISQPDTGEQALEICDILVRSGSIDVVVIDSVAALTPRAEIEGEMGDTHVGLQARLMS
ncbi:MAG: hypothetical protein R2706_03800 [Acidimicrobiales bacterium]